MLFRIGINLSDVLIDGQDILGDGVNIAARLEGITAGRHLSLSDDAYRQVQGRSRTGSFTAESRQLKNVSHPMGFTVSCLEERPTKPDRARRSRQALDRCPPLRQHERR